MVDPTDLSDEFDSLPVVALPPEFDGIDVFIVGGFVRDLLRDDAEPSDVDLMVTGVEPDELRARDGFTAIENETFPVFTDSLGREVALAREEQSDGAGHTDFEVFAVPADVDRLDALERDLVRRDIQCNSMALDPRTGELFDPHGGRKNLQEGVIKATNPDSFTEDPLRILRTARFAARLGHEIDEDTKELMKESAEEL